MGSLLIPSACGQQPSSRLEFDVVSVKPSNPGSTNGTVVNVTAGGRLHVVNATLKDLIETAYDIRRFQIEGGPKWADAMKYDIDATPNLSSEGTALPADWSNIRLEVQTLLRDRFRLELHRETKTASIYALGVAKGGVRSDALSSTQSPQQGINASLGKMLGEAASMAQLAYKLSRLLERPVVNSTGLEGNYNFKLAWTPDLGPSVSGGESADISGAPSLFTALQEQLGLRLEATKGPIDMLVIDSVEKPSDN